MKINLVEHFYSLQGEPQSLGRPAYFLRFPGCNLKCTFCDTTYASRTEKGKMIELSTLLEKIMLYETKLIVITGGEPLLRKRELLELHNFLPQDYIFEIETNGTQQPLWFTNKKREIRYNISPKLNSSGNKLSSRYQPIILNKFLENTDCIFKFVVKNNTDFKEVNKIVKQLSIPKSLIWIMPEGKKDTLIKKHALKFIEEIKQKGYSLTPRLHIWLYGQKKGV